VPGAVTDCLEFRRRDQAAFYFTGSATHREIAVTHFRGAKRTDSATSQFLNPEIASRLPAISAR
jgi:hypothetical protein